VSRLAKRLALALALAAAPRAYANPWDLYGFNPRARAMGSAHTAGADDFTGVYYNPASLTIAKDPGFGFAFVLSRPALSIAFDKAERSIAELEPPGSDGVTFGTMFPLAGARAARRAAVGLAINVPTSSLLDGQALDPAIPHWYMFQALPRRIVAALALGVAPWPWISAGIGMQILAGVSGKLEYELDVVAGRFSEKSVTFDIEPRAAPIVGLEVRPIEGLRIGASYRGSISSDVDLPVDLELTGIAHLVILTFFRVQYTPHQIAFGASYAIPEIGLTIAADLTYMLWSKAPDPSVRSSIDVGGALFEGTGLDMALDAPAPGQERAVDLAFRDVFVPRLGAELAIGPVQIRAGYGVRPSPTPEQTSGTNYVDATTHELSAGAGVRFRDPLDLLANPLIFDAAFSLFYVPPRRHEKIAPSDPIGSYEASGLVYVAGVAFRYEFGEAPAAPKPEDAPPPPPPTPKVDPAPDPPPDTPLPDGEDPEP
jgi:long-subunit fatty acid transport protein